MRRRRRSTAFDFSNLVRRLRGSSDWRAEHTEVAELLADDPSRALELAQALDESQRRDGFDVAIDAVRTGLLDIVGSVNDSAATAIAVQLASHPSTAHPDCGAAPELRNRGAMKVVGTRPSDEVRFHLETALHDDLEFGLLLTHELLLRGEAVPKSAGRYTEWAIASMHPLAPLPLELLECEASVWRWLPRYNGSAYSQMTLGPRVDGKRVPIADLLPCIGDPLDCDQTLITAPFREWLARSNGRASVGSYEIGGGGAPPSIEPSPGSTGGEAVSLDVAFETLFSAGVGGGAYSGSMGGAHSRLAAWRAVAGLINADWPRELAALANLATAADWFFLMPTDDWFDDVAWDVWLAVVLSDRVTLLAATDTD